MRIRISRKEAKECAYWLRLIRDTNEIERIDDVNTLITEAEELTKILSSIVVKSTL